MPRKIRLAKQRTHVDLTPALRHRFMCGAWADARISGWVLAAQIGDDAIAAVWAQHRDDIEADARAAGFAAAGLREDMPQSAARDRWAREFIMRWRY